MRAQIGYWGRFRSSLSKILISASERRCWWLAFLRLQQCMLCVFQLAIASLHLPSGSTGTIVRMKYIKNLTNGPEFLRESIL
jgi:hypothetical protein